MAEKQIAIDTTTRFMFCVGCSSILWGTQTKLGAGMVLQLKCTGLSGTVALLTMIPFRFLLSIHPQGKSKNAWITFICLINSLQLWKSRSGNTKIVSLLGVDSLWGDCTFIPADWGS
jgi:hypothetical protein